MGCSHEWLKLGKSECHQHSHLVHPDGLMIVFVLDVEGRGCLSAYMYLFGFSSDFCA